MAITALQGLLKTMCTALGQPRLLGKMAHALCARFTKRLENPQTFLPKSHVGLVLQRVAELSPEFSSSAYLTDTQLSRLKRVPAPMKCPISCKPFDHTGKYTLPYMCLFTLTRRFVTLSASVSYRFASV